MRALTFRIINTPYTFIDSSAYKSSWVQICIDTSRSIIVYFSQHTIYESYLSEFNSVSKNKLVRIIYEYISIRLQKKNHFEFFYYRNEIFFIRFICDKMFKQYLFVQRISPDKKNSAFLFPISSITSQSSPCRLSFNFVSTLLSGRLWPTDVIMAQNKKRTLEF